MIPYGLHEIDDADIEAVVSTLRSDFLTQGPVVGAFESALRERFGCDHVVLFNSASSALHAICIAEQLDHNDEVWTSSISYVASANCAALTGAKIRFIDIELDTGLISLAALHESLSEACRLGSLPKFLIPVHLAGHPCQMSELQDLSQQYGFKIVEDASHATGSVYQGSPVGSCKYSYAAVFSFHPVKIVTSGEGGAVATNDQLLAKRLRMIRENGVTKDKSEFVKEATSPWHYEQQLLGHNYKMTDIHASLGLSQLKRLDSILKKRNRIASRYLECLGGCSHINLVNHRADSTSSFHLMVAQFPRLSREQHISLFRSLHSSSINVQLHYQPIHLQPFYEKYAERPYVSLQNSETYAQTSLSLPLYTQLELDTVSQICDKVARLSLESTS